MNREIKFRAWGDGEMQTEFEISSLGVVGITDMFESYCSCPTWILMQFTGLHDKNGKEIYEGDIVKYQVPKYEDGDLIYTNRTIVGDVYFNCGMYWFGSLHSILPTRMEIIGNIYENPELLGGGA